MMVMPMPVPLLPLPRTQTPNEPVLALEKPENVTTTSAEAAAPPPVLAMTGSEAMDSFAITPLRRPAARRTQNVKRGVKHGCGICCFTHEGRLAPKSERPNTGGGLE